MKKKEYKAVAIAIAMGLAVTPSVSFAAENETVDATWDDGSEEDWENEEPEEAWEEKSEGYEEDGDCINADEEFEEAEDLKDEREEDFDDSGDEWEEDFEDSKDEWEEDFDDSEDEWEEGFEDWEYEWDDEFEDSGDEWEEDFDDSGDEWDDDVEDSEDEWEEDFDDFEDEWEEDYEDSEDEWEDEDFEDGNWEDGDSDENDEWGNEESWEWDYSGEGKGKGMLVEKEPADPMCMAEDVGTAEEAVPADKTPYVAEGMGANEGRKAESENVPGRVQSGKKAGKGNASRRVDYAEAKDYALAGTYVANAGMEFYSGAGEEKTVLAVADEDTKVYCYGYYTEKKGEKWLFVQYFQEGKAYTGFCKGSQMKKG